MFGKEALRNFLLSVQTAIATTKTYAVQSLQAFTNSQVRYFIVGDMTFNLNNLVDRAAKECKENDNAVAVFRLGPYGLGIHYAFIQPHTPDQAEQTLKIIMNLEEDGARSQFNAFNYLLGCQTIISTTGDIAKSLRRKMVGYFSHSRFGHESFIGLENVVEKTLGKPNLTSQREVQNHIRNIFSRVFFGSDIDDSLHEALNDLDILDSNELLLPSFTVSLLPNLRAQRKQNTENLKKVLRQIIHSYSLQESKGTPAPKNLLMDTLAEKCGAEKSFEQLSLAEIDQLSLDPDIRYCFSILLGISNTSKLLTNTLFDLSELPTVVKKLTQEVKEQNQTYLDYRTLMDKEKMPYLHAMYVEALRINSPVGNILRYTAKGIKELSIPPRSVICFDLKTGTHNEKMLPPCSPDEADEKNPEANNFYRPSRYIGTDGKVNSAANFYSGFFTPFGVGARRCPAANVTEVIFKTYLAEYGKQRADIVELPSSSGRVNLFESLSEDVKNQLLADVMNDHTLDGGNKESYLAIKKIMATSSSPKPRG